MQVPVAIRWRNRHWSRSGALPMGFSLVLILAVTASTVLATIPEREVVWQDAARVLPPEVIAMTDSVRTIYDSLGVTPRCYAGRMSSDWFHEDRWDPPWAGVLSFDENAGEPIWTWLQARGWEQRDGSEGPCSSLSVWVWDRWACVLHESWGPCFGLGEFTPEQEDSVYAAEGSSFDYSISFCFVDTVKTDVSR